MDYMKNAVMTGTRRIARSVPMSMPNSKSIQKHITIPKVRLFELMFQLKQDEREDEGGGK